MLSHFSHVWLFVTPWTVARQAPLSMEFFRQEYWSELPFPSPGDLPNPRIKPMSPDSLPLQHLGTPIHCTKTLKDAVKGHLKWHQRGWIEESLPGRRSVLPVTCRDEHLLSSGLETRLRGGTWTPRRRRCPNSTQNEGKEEGGGRQFQFQKVCL